MNLYVQKSDFLFLTAHSSVKETVSAISENLQPKIVSEIYYF